MERKITGIGVLAGLIAGVVAFVYARIFIEPQVARAIDYEDERSHAESMITGEHGHEHELFTRSVQENIGAGIGTVIFAVAMGAFFAVAFVVLWSYLGRHRPSTDPRFAAIGLAAAAFVAVIGVPYFVYPPNPPAVGDEDTIGARSGAYLTLTLVSVALMVAAAALYFWLADRIGGLQSGLAAAVVYLVGVTITSALLPSFAEIPGPVMDGDRIVGAGFPGQVVADFRVYAIANQVLLWTVLTAVFVALLGRMARREASRELESVGAQS
ncbi:CbtA family protein [Gordonia hydrophobica]|uniref:CbtA family protein n=1 Tax=Gordonia hydrophobica TaxID=40516 RepID=A0ABZ2U1Q0_9ACTN|nr:CbtA family protein [Gordonia hydrophobica]MBM7366679.1 Fe2+ transport system protein B [Gordonia hydrophobica]